MSCAKTTKPVELLFAILSLVGARNHVLDGGPNPTWRGILRGVWLIEKHYESIGFGGLWKGELWNTGGLILTIYTSHERKDVHFWGYRWYCCPFRGSYPPKNHFGARVCIFTTGAQSVKTFILLKLLYRFQPNFVHDKDHQVVYVGFPLCVRWV